MQPTNPTPSTLRGPVSESPAVKAGSGYDLDLLRGKLGMTRDVTNLGYVEKAFDGCRMGVKGKNGKCGANYLTVVNFQILCRDSEDTVQEIVTNFTPVVTNNVKWKLAEMDGVTETNSSGYGRVQFLTPKSSRGKRLVLTIGRQFLGLEISQVSKIVVPIYWCSQLAKGEELELTPVRLISDIELDH